MSLHDVIEREILDHIFGNGGGGVQDYVPPPTLYLALSTNDPGEIGFTIAEPGDTNYARQSMPNNTTNWAAAVDDSGVGTKTNLLDLTFPAAATGYGTISHWALFDALSGGNMIVYGTLTPNVGIGASEQLTIKAGSLKITCD